MCKPLTLADIIDQIRRDVHALDDPWLDDDWWRDFYLARIESFKEWGREIEDGDRE